MENAGRVFFYISLAVVLTNIPVIGVYVSLCNTLIHEVCHALCGIITGGKVHKISLHLDASGSALTSNKSRIARILVSYAGYTGSSAAAILLFYFLSQEYYKAIIYFFITVACVSTLLWVRNFIGFLWGLSFIAALYALIHFKWDGMMMHVGMFLSSVVLVQSVISAFTICVS